jgi:hypothetical protein
MGDKNLFSKIFLLDINTHNEYLPISGILLGKFEKNQNYASGEHRRKSAAR